MKMRGLRDDGVQSLKVPSLSQSNPRAALFLFLFPRRSAEHRAMSRVELNAVISGVRFNTAKDGIGV